jgi:hypothetical protein
MRDCHGSKFEELKENGIFTSKISRDYEITNFDNLEILNVPKMKG